MTAVAPKSYTTAWDTISRKVSKVVGNENYIGWRGRRASPRPPAANPKSKPGIRMSYFHFEESLITLLRIDRRDFCHAHLKCVRGEVAIFVPFGLTPVPCQRFCNVEVYSMLPTDGLEAMSP